ncbi:MAG TPA: CmcI family methyltransferase [Candidatus Angelobacter sp.]|nr:CmcI family methyltransferase [Candidatus Angelobacter sp.]
MNEFASVIVIFAGAAFVADMRRRKLSLTRTAGWNLLLGLDVAALTLTAALAAGLVVMLISGISAHRLTPPMSLALASLVFFVGVGAFLVREGRRQVQLQRPAGLVFAEFMILGGSYLVIVALVLPRGFAFYGAPAVTATRILVSVLPIAIGGGLIALVVPSFIKGHEEHRILERIADQGEFVQSEWIPPTPECAHPERWQMLDPQSAEVEVLDLLEALIKAVKPELIVETGTFIGHSAIRMARALQSNGFGRIITIEYDPIVFAKARQNIDGSGLGRWIEYRNASSLETAIKGAIDLLYCDSDVNIREQEVRRFLPQVRPRGLVLIHDASSHFKVVREAALRLEEEGLLSVVLLSTARGLCIAQKREGRT